MGEQVEYGDEPTVDEFIAQMQEVHDEIFFLVKKIVAERDSLKLALLRACRHVSYCGTECPRTGGVCVRPDELDEEGRCGACGFDGNVDFVAECWRIEFMKPEDGGDTSA